jgi:hypothetical protein
MRATRAAPRARATRRYLLRLTLIATVGAPGCAWRTANAEHYFGPVLFRYSEERQEECAVNDLWQVGVLAEGGRQWGLAVGAAERLTADLKPADGTAAPRWTRPWSFWPETTPGKWNLSLLYLRGDNVKPPLMLWRRLIGGGAMAGSELSAVSVGYSSRLTVLPAQDSFSVLVFNSNRPLQSVCKILPVEAVRNGSLSQTLEEVR